MIIEFSQNADKAFSSLDKTTQVRIAKKLVEIKSNPQRHLFSLTNREFEKLRVGDYRLFCIFDKEKNTLFILEIKHRKNAYK